MADATPFPFATIEELKARWPDMPPGADDHAKVQLEDASQFILDTVPTAGAVSPLTRRRIVCAVVRRAMAADDSDMAGMESFQIGAGSFNMGGKVRNPDADFYLTKQERKALGDGAQKAFGVQVAVVSGGRHLPWCSVNFRAACSCGVDLAGVPIFEDA